MDKSATREDCIQLLSSQGAIRRIGETSYKRYQYIALACWQHRKFAKTRTQNTGLVCVAKANPTNFQLPYPLVFAILIDSVMILLVS